MSKKNQNLRLIKLKKFYKKNLILLIICLAIIILGSFAIFIGNTNSNNNEILLFGDDIIEFHYFHLSTCPHCHKQSNFMDRVITEKYPNVKIIEYEMSKRESLLKYQELAKNIEGLNENNFPGTPLTIINEEFNIGFGSDETTGQKLISMIENQQNIIDSTWDDSTMTKTIDLRSN